MQWQRSQQPTCEESLLSPIAVEISDCFSELAGVVVMEDATTEEGEGIAETGGEVVLLIDKALTNLSPSDPRSCIEGGSSLKNKLLYTVEEHNHYKVRSVKK